MIRQRMRFSELIPTLQMSVGPVILISGVGLLLLSMTNRFGRVIDRARFIAEALRKNDPQSKARLSSQIPILSRRAQLLRRAITFATMSVFMAALLVMGIFITAIFGANTAILIAVFFLASMIFLILSLVAFLQDLNLSLQAMELEIDAAPNR
jgi:hypothetical protein